MSDATRQLPEGTVNCRSGDYLITPAAEDVWKVFEVETLVAISRLLPIGDRTATEFIEEHHALDSERPMGMDEIYILATVFMESFGSQDAAVRAIESTDLPSAIPHVCLNIRKFPAAATTVYYPKNPRHSPANPRSRSPVVDNAG
jgi:hypothetical protein